MKIDSRWYAEKLLYSYLFVVVVSFSALDRVLWVELIAFIGRRFRVSMNEIFEKDFPVSFGCCVTRVRQL
jgi:hypothetical protein